MRILTPEECAAWCREHDVSLGDGDEPQFPEGADLLSFAVPHESGVQLALARDVAEWLGAFGSALLWMTDWPMSHDDETSLVQGWRRAHGEGRPLIEAPGHLLEERERIELINLLFLSMAFGWDAFLLTARRGDLLYFSHHDIGDAYTHDRERLTHLREALRLFNLRVLKL